MNKLLLLALCAALILLVASCSDETVPPPSQTTNRPASTMESIGTGSVKRGDANAPSAVGGIVSVVTVPVPSPGGVGVSVAADCDGNLYYTNSYSPILYKIDAVGGILGSVKITDAAGKDLTVGEMAWDGTRNKLWAGTDNSGSPVQVWLIDPATGIATYVFTSTIPGVGFTDGLAFDGTDNSIWVSDDVSKDIDHFKDDGTWIGTLTPTNAAGNTLGSISGVAVGKGNVLYLGQNGHGKIVTVDKTTGAYISDFSTPGGRDEGLECDVINFPTEVLWSKDAFDDEITAIEVEEGTCECQGGRTIGFDIKPGSCPNPLNVADQGLMPVAILGSADFDVSLIDINSVYINGVQPVNSASEDVSTRYPGDLDDCLSCWTAGADGFVDLTLKFNAQEIVASLDAVADGDCITLTITGLLTDGSPFQGSDIIRINKKGKINNAGGSVGGK